VCKSANEEENVISECVMKVYFFAASVLRMCPYGYGVLSH